MKISHWMVCVFSCLIPIPLGCWGMIPQPQGQAQAGAETQRPQALPASLSGFSDEGTFLRYVGEKPVVKISFKWQADGAFENRRLSIGDGQDVSGVTKVIPDKDGRWVKISVEGPNGVTNIAREGDAARVTFKDQTETVTLKSGAVLFGALAPALMSQPVRLYDRVKGGKQVFPVFRLGAGDMVEASLELKDKVKRSVRGKELELTRYIYRLPMVDFTLWVDAEGKLYLAENQMDHSFFVREGYEALHQAAGGDTADTGIKGAWQGALDAGGAKLRLVVRISQAPDGNYTAKLDSPDQGATGIPIDTVTFWSRSLRLELKLIEGVYEGTLSKDGSEFVGEWKQAGQTFPLTLKRPDRVTR